MKRKTISRGVRLGTTEDPRERNKATRERETQIITKNIREKRQDIKTR
jgi:hypothetical protein